MHRKDSGLIPALCFTMGKGVGWRSWVNFIWSSPDFRVIICGGNGHISPARNTKFGFNHTFSHPTIHIPTVAILYTFGLPYTSFRVHRSLLLYLHRTLIKDDDDWVKKTLLTLKNLDIGWYRNVLTVLELYQLPTDFDEIRRHPPGEWKYKVLSRIEVKNKEKLLQECHKTVDGTETRKTKTASIVDKLNDPYYKWEPIAEIKKLKKSETRTLMIARYGMLQCGKNLEAPWIKHARHVTV